MTKSLTKSLNPVLSQVENVWLPLYNNAKIIITEQTNFLPTPAQDHKIIHSHKPARDSNDSRALTIGLMAQLLLYLISSSSHFSTLSAFLRNHFAWFLCFWCSSNSLSWETKFLDFYLCSGWTVPVFSGQKSAFRAWQVFRTWGYPTLSPNNFLQLDVFWPSSHATNPWNYLCLFSIWSLAI